MQLNNILDYHLNSISDINICVIDNLKNKILEIEKKIETDIINKIFRNISFYSLPRTIDDNVIIVPIIFSNQVVGFIIIQSDKKNISDNMGVWNLIADLLCFIIISNYDFSYLNIYLYEKFTIREKEVLSQVILGRKDKEISKNLCISLPTVRKHINNIFEKEKVSNKYEFLIKYYSKNN
ncbi:MAG: helix-turn-helix transcriptional regulator [Streptococcus parauberis]